MVSSKSVTAAWYVGIIIPITVSLEYALGVVAPAVLASNVD